MFPQPYFELQQEFLLKQTVCWHYHKVKKRGNENKQEAQFWTKERPNRCKTSFCLTDEDAERHHEASLTSNLTKRAITLQQQIKGKQKPISQQGIWSLKVIEWFIFHHLVHRRKLVPVKRIIPLNKGGITSLHPPRDGNQTTRRLMQRSFNQSINQSKKRIDQSINQSNNQLYFKRGKWFNKLVFRHTV